MDRNRRDITFWCLWIQSRRHKDWTKESRNKKAVKVWDKREFSNLDGDVELGTRNIKVALRRLRKFAREGAETELDLDNTIKSTAHKGYIDVKMMPERRNKNKSTSFL